MNCSLIKLFQIKNIFTIQSNIGLLHIFPLLSSHCFGHPINFSFFPCLSILLEITFSAIVENHFERQHHKMQETCNNYFGLKKCSTTLYQAIIGKNECRKVTSQVFDICGICKIFALHLFYLLAMYPPSPFGKKLICQCIKFCKITQQSVCQVNFCIYKQNFYFYFFFHKIFDF